MVKHRSLVIIIYSKHLYKEIVNLVWKYRYETIPNITIISSVKKLSLTESEKILLNSHKLLILVTEVWVTVRSYKTSGNNQYTKVFIYSNFLLNKSKLMQFYKADYLKAITKIREYKMIFNKVSKEKLNQLLVITQKLIV